MSITRGTLTWQYGGDILALTEDNGIIIEVMSGVFGFPPLVVEGADLETHGAYVREVRAKGRKMMLGMWATSTEARDALMALLVAGATGTLAATVGTQQRTISARVTGVNVQVQPHGWKIALNLLAEWPWWAGDAVTYTFGEDERPLFFPILPLRVTSGGVYSSATVNVAGNGITYPTFSITGPADYVELRNITTGKTMRINAALAAGQQRVITMGNVATVVDASGVNRMGEASGTFWPLLPGANMVQIIAPNTSPDTQVSMTYRPSFAGAW